MKGKIFIISGPSGSGKTTLQNRLLAEEPNLVKTVSVTTRPPRPGEIPDKDYYFVTPKMFLYKIRAGHFLEYQKVFNNYYGTPKKQVDQFLREQKNILLCIDVKGTEIVRKKFPQATSIFVKTSSVEELKRRLVKRGSENSRDFQLRMKTALRELKEQKNYNHIIDNNNLETASKRLLEIVRSELKKRMTRINQSLTTFEVYVKNMPPYLLLK